MQTVQVSSGNGAPLQRIPRKPTLLAVINSRRDVTMLRLAMAANVPRNELLAVLQSNTATPKVAEKIIAALRQLTNHRWTVLDIDWSVHPARPSCTEAYTD